MRYKYLLILPLILWVWTIFQAYRGGALGRGSVHKTLFLIVNNSETLIKDMLHERKLQSDSVNSKETERSVPTDSVSIKIVGEVTKVSEATGTTVPTQKTSSNVAMLTAEEKGTPKKMDECSKDGENLGKIDLKLYIRKLDHINLSKQHYQCGRFTLFHYLKKHDKIRRLPSKTLRY